MHPNGKKTFRHGAYRLIGIATVLFLALGVGQAVVNQHDTFTTRCPYCYRSIQLTYENDAWHATPAVDKNTSEIIENETYFNRIFNFKLTRPNTDWQFYPRGTHSVLDNPDIDVALVNQNKWGFTEVFAQFTSDSLASLKEAVLKQLQKNLKDSAIVNEETNDNHPFASTRVDLAGTVNDIRFFYSVTLLKQDDIFVQLVSFCPEPAAKSLETEFTAIADSFKFLTSKGTDK